MASTDSSPSTRADLQALKERIAKVEQVMAQIDVRQQLQHIDEAREQSSLCRKLTAVSVPLPENLRVHPDPQFYRVKL